MRDELDDLSDLRGVDVHPLPAAEIQARGDRLRRRRTTLTVLGAAAMVAVVALTAGLIGGGADRGAPGPATSSPNPTADQTPGSTTAPDPPPAGSLADQFPLALGLPETNEDGSPVRVRIGTQDDLVLCGQTAWTGAGAMDLATASFAQPEDHRGRTLLLYPTVSRATDALSVARGALAACPSEELGGTEQVFTPLTGESSGADQVAFILTYRTDGRFDTGLTVYRLVRVGAALLFTVDYGEANSSEQSAADISASTLAGTQRVVDEMRIFGSSPETTGALIPPDFPLDDYQVARTGDDGEMLGPAPDAPGLGTNTLCGQDIWPIAPNERLASNATGPEYTVSLELVRFLDAEAAVNVLTALRQRVRSCPSEPIEGGTSGVVDKVHAVQQVDLGYENVTFAEFVADGRLGLTVYQFVRVGSGVLALAESSEGNEAGIAGTVADLTAISEVLAPQMCVFASDGCPG